MQTQKFIAKKSFRVDELAKELGVKKFVIKNWEKQFDIKKCGSDNKYTQEDLKIFATIKNLVFIKKMPPALAKKHLQDALAGQLDEQKVTALENEDSAQMLQEVTEELNPESNNAKLQSSEPYQEHTNQEAAIATEQAEVPSSDLGIQEQTLSLKQEESQIQESMIQESVIEQWILEQITAAQASSKISCLQAKDEEAIDILDKVTDKVTENARFQGAQEIMQQENTMAQSKELEESTMQEVLPVENATEKMLPEESIYEEVLAAQMTDEITEIKPALKEKEEFIRTIQSFKEQLLKIHDQLK